MTPPKVAPTLADLRITEATLRALAEQETDDCRANFIMLVALDLRRRIRDADDEACEQMRRQQWAAVTRARVGRGHR